VSRVIRSGQILGIPPALLAHLLKDLNAIALLLPEAMNPARDEP
jgi:hypothetical protein